MDFEWDQEKDAANIRRHDLALKEGAAIFSGVAPIWTEEDSSERYGELRERSIGYSDIGILVVVHTERAEGVIRLISVRRTEKNEKRFYRVYCQKIAG